MPIRNSDVVVNPHCVREGGEVVSELLGGSGEVEGGGGGGGVMGSIITELLFFYVNSALLYLCKSIM